jgi:hypothetical protein
MKKPKPTPAQVLATANRMYSEIAAISKKRGDWKSHWKDDLSKVSGKLPEEAWLIRQWHSLARWHLAHGGKP